MFGHARAEVLPEPVDVEAGSKDEWYASGNNMTTTQLLSSKGWQHANVFTHSGLVQRLTMIQKNGMPAMRVISASRLEGLGEIPRSDLGHAEDALAAVQRCGRDSDNRPKAVLVMFSHRWLRPLWPDPKRQAHPDSADGVKAKAIVQWAKWFKWWRIFGAGRSFVHGITTDPDLEVFFWIDYCCVDQDNPGPEMAGLPAYVSACAEVVIFKTADYDMRAWCQVELMMAYAFMTVGDKLFQIPPGFEHRRQGSVVTKRYTLPDPLQGNLTCEADRKVIGELRECAVRSSSFTLANTTRWLFCSSLTKTMLWVVCLCGWLGLAPWLTARRILPGRSVSYRMTPKATALDTDALIEAATSMDTRLAGPAASPAATAVLTEPRPSAKPGKVATAQVRR